MPLLWIEVPYTRAQRLRRWVAAICIVVAATAFAAWAALDCARIVFGYVASYTFAEVFFLSVTLAIVGLPMLVYWRTRSTGASLVVSGLVMYLVFLGTIGILKKLDRVAWVHEPPLQHFGPDQSASLVIYYRPGTTAAQIEDFVEHKLENYPSNIHDGKDFPDFVNEYLGLIPSQANGYSGSALTFRQGAHGPAVDAFVAMIQADPRVFRIFRDTSPQAIDLPKSEQAASPNEHIAPRNR